MRRGRISRSGPAGSAAVQRAANPGCEAMTLRFIVARILRELIELAECDDDAELVEALHDALDVASPRAGCDAESSGVVDRKM